MSGGGSMWNIAGAVAGCGFSGERRILVTIVLALTRRRMFADLSGKNLSTVFCVRTETFAKSSFEVFYRGRRHSPRPSPGAPHLY